MRCQGPHQVHPGRPVRRQGGVALAIVLWFIAGMSLLVAGIVAQARVDTHMAQIHMARARAVAAGDGAIQLMMVDLMTGGTSEPGTVPVGNYRVGDTQVTVVMTPSSGLIDINSASAELLSALFLLAGGLGEEQARLLAENMVQSRTIGPVRGGGAPGGQLDAVEDLLRVPGSSRTLLDAVRDFIVVREQGQGGMNWADAPDALLGVLEKASPAQAGALMARRGGAAASFPRPPGSIAGSGDTTGITAGAYRADAIVRHGDTIWLRRRWISIESGASSALPWHSTRTEPPRVLTQDSYLLGRIPDA